MRKKKKGKKNIQNALPFYGSIRVKASKCLYGVNMQYVVRKGGDGERREG